MRYERPRRKLAHGKAPLLVALIPLAIVGACSDTGHDIAGAGGGEGMATGGAGGFSAGAGGSQPDETQDADVELDAQADARVPGSNDDANPADAPVMNRIDGPPGGWPAKSADSVVDIIGVNGHLNYEGSTYTTHFDDAIVPRARELGLRNWRDSLNPSSDILARQAKLAAAGVRLNLYVGDLDVGVVMTNVKKALVAMQAVEGPNELDHGFRNGQPVFPDASTRTYKGVGFPQMVALFQNELYAAIKGDPQTKHLPVLMAGFSFPDNTLDVGLVEGCDCGNTHSYPDGGSPTYRLDDWYIPRMKANSGPNKPLCSTETGYHNTPAGNGGHWIYAVSPRAAGKYILRLYLEYFNRGFAKAYIYEFANVYPGDTSSETNFGLLRSDGVPKEQYSMLRNLIEILKDPGPAFALSKLDYELSGETSNVHHALLQKRDGSFYLALWANELSYDKTTGKDLEVKKKVNLSLRTPVSRVEVYRPADSAASTSQYSAPPALELEVPDHPLILRLWPQR